MALTGETSNLLQDKLILAYYIDIRHIDDGDVPMFMNRVMGQVKSNSPAVGEIIALPIRSETRVECINPKYITEPELIREHRLKMDELQEILSKYIEEENGREKME